MKPAPPFVAIDSTLEVQFLSQQRGLLTRLFLLAIAVLLAGQIALAWFALIGFERKLEPQLNQKANAVGYAISSQLSFAVGDLRIPSEDLVGVDAYFDNILASNKDIKYLSLIDPSGNVLFLRGILPETMIKILAGLSNNMGGSNFEVDIEGHVDGSFPIYGIEDLSSILHVGVSSEHVVSQLSEILYEIITVIIISWLVTFEFLSFFMGSHVSEPLENIRKVLSEGANGVFANRLVMRTRDEVGQLVTSFNTILRHLQNRYNDFVFDARELMNAQIDSTVSHKISEVHKQVNEYYLFTGGQEVRSVNVKQIRAPLFLFIFSEEISRSFLPLFISRYAPTDMAVPYDVLVGLPITLFMLAALIITPIGGGLVDRFGVRRVLLAGIAAAILGYVGNFFTQGYIDLIVYRILSGIGFGLVFIASDSWITQNAERGNRTQSNGIFVGAVFVGITCGPPIGGIFADRIGFEATFLISAFLAIVSGYIVYLMFRNAKLPDKSVSSQLMLGMRDWLTLLKDARFVAVLLLAAIPGRMMFAGFLIYLVPLYLNELGHNQSSIGRIMMVYGITTITFVSLAARFADRSGKYSYVVAIGGTITGLGCIVSLFSDSVSSASNTLLIAIFTLGFGHALTLTSQNAIIQLIAKHYRGTMGRASVISAYRTVERFGMAIGPMIAVALIGAFGYRGAIAGFGSILLGLTVLFLIVMVRPANKQVLEEPDVANA